ncbi:hypothetical protein C0992_005761, partial [Termitomyces sp. T32_za158]
MPVSKDEEAKIICADCTVEPDLILLSSDGVKLAAHAQNLERYSMGFPPASFNVTDWDEVQTVELEETSGTLRLLLQYVHLKPQPDIERIPFEQLEALADALEKYLVYGGMMVCKLYMKSNASVHPMNVLRYAVKHGYKDVADKAAPYTITYSPFEVRGFFGNNSRVFHIWVAYRDQWMSALPLIYTRDIPYPTLHRGGQTKCELWDPFRDAVRRDVECLPSQIARFDDVVAGRIKLDLQSCDR